MRKLLKNRKALSPVIAAIILIAVTVAVSIAVAAWMGALTIGFMGTEELKITDVDFTGDTSVDIWVQNTGSTTVVVVETKVGGQSYTLDPEETFLAGDKKSVNWVGTGLVQGTSYNIEVVTAKGNRFVSRATYPL